jgi:prephenate dehydrogenase
MKNNMENNIKKAVRKVLIESRYEDVKDKIENSRGTLRFTGKITNFVIKSTNIIKKLLSFEKNWLEKVREDSELHDDLEYISAELSLLKMAIKEIPKKNNNEKLKKEDLQYYGFEYKKIKRICDKHLNFFEDIISKYKNKFNETPELLKQAIRAKGEMKRLLELIEGLE